MGRLLVGSVLLGLAAACGSSSSSAEPTTTTEAETPEAWGARVEADCSVFTPGFDEFMTEHPEPTTVDYVEFLPTQIDGMGSMRDCIAASNPPAEVKERVDAVVAAMDVVLEDFDQALAAAADGDLDSTNEWLTKMHEQDVAKIDEAFAAIDRG